MTKSNTLYAMKFYGVLGFFLLVAAFALVITNGPIN